MRANRKFLRSSDEAVSPVIGVILMVAITVVLAATVYVWVSGFGAQTSTPSQAISLASTTAIETLPGGADADTLKTYTISTATPGFKWGNIQLTLDGAVVPYDDALVADETGFQLLSGSATTPVANGAMANTGVLAGQTLKIQSNGDLSGQTLRLVDLQSNAVILTVTVG